MLGVVYISGGISAYKDGQRELFREVATIWEAKGYAVINPHDLVDKLNNYLMDNWNRTARYDEMMLECIQHIVNHATVIAALKDWERSRGAVCEVTVGTWKGIPIVDAYNGNKFAHIEIYNTIRILESNQSLLMSMDNENNCPVVNDEVVKMIEEISK
jgi:hypothetical protein